jgi:hypothetical protein
MTYFKCKQCGFCFKIEGFILNAMKYHKRRIICQNCQSTYIVKCLNVEYLNNKGRMNKKSWVEYKSRGVDV